MFQGVHSSCQSKPFYVLSASLCVHTLNTLHVLIVWIQWLPCSLCYYWPSQEAFINCYLWITELCISHDDFYCIQYIHLNINSLHAPLIQWRMLFCLWFLALKCIQWLFQQENNCFYIYCGIFQLAFPIQDAKIIQFLRGRVFLPLLRRLWRPVLCCHNSQKDFWVNCRSGSQERWSWSWVTSSWMSLRELHSPSCRYC